MHNTSREMEESGKECHLNLPETISAFTLVTKKECRATRHQKRGDRAK